VPGELPSAIRLLLTHQDYVKIFSGGLKQEEMVGRFFRDFGFVPKELRDVYTNVIAPLWCPILFYVYACFAVFF
jgi:hypothetical protein